MDIKLYRNHVPREWLVKDSFLDRNPNMSYLLSSGKENSRSILIDASGDVDRIIHDLEQRGSTLDYILVTHSHPDHTFNLSVLEKKFTNISIGIHPTSLKALPCRESNNFFPLKEGMVIRDGDIELTVVYSPGHTLDSVCYWDRNENHFFSGDVIFGGNIGCSAYQSGGNRNTFYKTIVNLLEILPSNTKIYPGHSSETYQTMPPYSLSAEKVKNSYLSNALQGNRGHFDRDLKEFSIEFEPDNYVMLHEPDIDKIYALEKETWIPELQASRETILTRLRSGHKILAINEYDGLWGVIGWCYSRFSIHDPVNNFPKKFTEFSTRKSCSEKSAQSAFIYNVGVKPGRRGKGVGSLLLQWAFEKIKEDGIHQIFLDSRLPSYNGSQQTHHEKVDQNQEFRKAIDRYFTGNQFPDDRVFMLDSRVRFYMKNDLKPWLILKDFIQDKPSGNIRVICYLNLDHDDKGVFR
ncbi:MAG: GNAT family N-acetyltransferase [Thermodesulfobacteriota bacterium]|nr:GNAT family N-acetyltransferase [Thermodesulfobacteriota bacterium]